MSIQEKVLLVLEQIEFEIDRANKLLNYDPNANIQEERIRFMNVLHKAGKLIEEISGGIKSVKRD